MTVVYTRAARDQLDGVAAYLLLRNPGAAASISEDIQSAISRLVELPFSGRQQDESDVRKAVSPACRYKIFYVFDEGIDTIIVLSIMHPAQYVPGTDDI